MHWTDGKQKETKILSCGHSSRIDRSHKFGNGLFGPEKKVLHIICLECDMHFYKDREYTKKEWDDYVNDISEK